MLLWFPGTEIEGTSYIPQYLSGGQAHRRFFDRIVAFSSCDIENCTFCVANSPREERSSRQHCNLLNSSGRLGTSGGRAESSNGAYEGLSGCAVSYALSESAKLTKHFIELQKTKKGPTVWVRTTPGPCGPMTSRRPSCRRAKMQHNRPPRYGLAGSLAAYRRRSPKPV